MDLRVAHRLVFTAAPRECFLHEIVTGRILAMNVVAMGSTILVGTKGTQGWADIRASLKWEMHTLRRGRKMSKSSWKSTLDAEGTTQE